ncbi:MAG TPA: C10 family peptidase [Synergistaceae bacterium]|nr:C10 family peptidase [Synergistaceae bacterium]HPJ25138.1 C10 family peptidase [Synergistaceae bacterium]HPQ36797.1 C10 family peptidase [Synergistaceae bacterium]
MKHRKKQRIFRGPVIAFITIFYIFLGGMLPGFEGASAAPVTETQALQAAISWLERHPAPLEENLGQNVKDLISYSDARGNPLYYVAFLAPRGFLILGGDDLLEPVIALVPEGTAYDPSEKNPLGALVTRDLTLRAHEARTAPKVSRILEQRHLSNISKWKTLLEEDLPSKNRLPSLADLRVAPLLQSTWSQGNVNEEPCYNYYTPHGYPCGCVATAMAQIIRFHEHPSEGVGRKSFTIFIDEISEDRTLRGGNGLGGPYDWNAMVLQPDASITEAQRQAIGALTYDAGLSVFMHYTDEGSGTDTLMAGDALTEVFGYSNAIKSYNGGENLSEDFRNAAVLPNLDAGYPVLFGITGSEGGHAIVGDGYGYQGETLYHHLNLGWAGNSNAWYNLPDIDVERGNLETEEPMFTSVYKVVYNIFAEGTGEILSGRILDQEGNPLENVTVTLSGPSLPEPRTTQTNSRGMYAFAAIPSGSTYTLRASAEGYIFSPSFRTERTGISENWGPSGNLREIDFAGTPGYPSSGGGGCSLGFLPGALILLLPLVFFRK